MRDTMSSIVFVVSALETIAASKEAHKKPQLGEATKRALDDIKAHEPQLPDPEVIFLPLQLATTLSTNIILTTTALDCISKLISYSYFSVPSATPAESDPDRAPLIERAIDTICNCFQGESTPVEVQLQIVGSLLAAVLNDKIIVHGAGLLKAVRQVYNVFLLSKNSRNQQVAQGTLTQMVGTVFERVKTRIHMKEARQNLSRLGKTTANGSFVTITASESFVDGSVVAESESIVGTYIERVDSETSQSAEDGPKLTLKDLEHRKDFDDSHMGDGPTMVTQLKQKASRAASVQSPEDGSEESGDDEGEDEVYVRDAYLVFRSFCNLSTKILPPDQLFDLKSQAMRSKLISLHLIHHLLNNHVLVFASPLCTITNSKSNEKTSFLSAVKFYLCLSITRNGASSVDRVYEVCCEIFWLMLKYMRAPFKASNISLSGSVIVSNTRITERD
jgi:brefeldin A-inhibited guanine nucleotide-exchange protein